MNSSIPAHVRDTINLLTKEASEQSSQGQALVAQGQGLIGEAESKRKLADQLAQTYGKLGGDEAGKNAAKKINGELTIGNIREYLSRANGRPAHLAKHFKVTEQIIRDLVNAPDSKITPDGRGWLRLNLI